MINYRLFVLLLLLPFHLAAQQANVVNLRCEYRSNPLGVDVFSPKFSWEIISGKRSVIQTGFRILVADSPDSLKNGSGNMWDSGKRRSAQSIQLAYQGKTLTSAKTYYWRVEVWDNQAETSHISEPGTFTTGLFQPADWGAAKWIGYESMPDSMQVVPGVHGNGNELGGKLLYNPVTPLFRKDFQLGRPVASALIFVCGLGQYEMFLNGKKVSDDLFTPGWTYYDKTCLYNTYDVTRELATGRNVLGIITGNGFYNIHRDRYRKLVIGFGFPKMILKMKITFSDGSVQMIDSDSTWKTDVSPVTFNSIYGGEDYDARLEQAGWDKTGFNDAQWKNAIYVKAPKGILKADNNYPIKVNETFDPKKVDNTLPGTVLYDFGQNASGIVELKVKGERGQTIKLTPSELITEQKMPNQNATGKPYYFTYVLKGDGVETWRPKFSYYGFRYVQVEGVSTGADTSSVAKPLIEGLRLLHTGNSAAVTGSFECSNDLFNKIFTLINWAIKSNLQSIVTDCPHREKLSWLEEDHLMGGSIHYNFDLYGLYKKLVFDMMDAQTEEGLVPDIAPEFVPFVSGFRDSPEWGSASVILPWFLYTWYGDKGILEQAYPMMKKYVAYLEKKSTNHILDYGLGDWFDYGPRTPGEAQLTPKSLTASAIYYYDLTLLKKMAVVLKKKKDARQINRLSKKVQKAFNSTLFNRKDNTYATGSQTAMSMPLCVGLVGRKYRSAVFKNLTDSIEQSGKKLTAGDVGFHFLVKALDEGGGSQLIYDMNYRDDVPGYGFQLKKGATTLTESWPALEEVSNNHLMLGHIMEWFYSGLAGITQPADGVAYEEVLIRPQVVGNLVSAKGSFHSPYGVIKSEWKKENGTFSLHVEIPVNSKATVMLPATPASEILENGLPVTGQSDIKISGYEKNNAILKIGSGVYEFTVR